MNVLFMRALGWELTIGRESGVCDLSAFPLRPTVERTADGWAIRSRLGEMIVERAPIAARGWRIVRR
jgi:hypothetical protein